MKYKGCEVGFLISRTIVAMLVKKSLCKSKKLEGLWTEESCSVLSKRLEEKQKKKLVFANKFLEKKEEENLEDG